MDIGFIGFGLIGGSIAKGLKKVHPEYRIIVTSRSKTPLYEAQKQGVVDIVATEVDNSFKNCDYIYEVSQGGIIERSHADIFEKKE